MKGRNLYSSRDKFQEMENCTKYLPSAHVLRSHFLIWDFTRGFLSSSVPVLMVSLILVTWALVGWNIGNPTTLRPWSPLFKSTHPFSCIYLDASIGEGGGWEEKATEGRPQISQREPSGTFQVLGKGDIMNKDPCYLSELPTGCKTHAGSLHSLSALPTIIQQGFITLPHLHRITWLEVVNLWFESRESNIRHCTLPQGCFPQARGKLTEFPAVVLFYTLSCATMTLAEGTGTLQN